MHIITIISDSCLFKKLQLKKTNYEEKILLKKIQNDGATDTTRGSSHKRRASSPALHDEELMVSSHWS